MATRFNGPPSLLGNTNTIVSPEADATFGNSIVLATTPVLVRSLHVQIADAAAAPCAVGVFDADQVSGNGRALVKGTAIETALLRSALLAPGDVVDFAALVADAYQLGGFPLDRGLVVIASTTSTFNAAGIAAAGDVLRVTARLQLGPC